MRDAEEHSALCSMPAAGCMDPPPRKTQLQDDMGDCLKRKGYSAADRAGGVDQVDRLAVLT